MPNSKRSDRNKEEKKKKNIVLTVGAEKKLGKKYEKKKPAL